MKAYIVTGTTRGIGRAIAETVIKRKAQLFSISSAPDKVEPMWHNFECDMRRPEKLRHLLDRLLKSILQDAYDDLVLINNAGVLEPMGPVEEADDGQIINHLHVNVAAPAILLSAFIGATAEFSGDRRIINISSGAAVYPYAGWAMYCASKSALDMITLCAASEQQGQVNPVSICSVYPGKVETDMQRAVRQSDPKKFPAQPSFVLAREQGAVFTPGEVARNVIEYDAAGKFKNGCIYDLRSALSQGLMDTIQPIRSLFGDDP